MKTNRQWNTRRSFGLALVALCAVTAPSTRAQPATDNVVIVLDASGSMNRTMPRSSMTKMDAAKQALTQVLRQVPQSTQVGLLVFSARNLTQDWVLPLGPRQDAALQQTLQSIQPQGDTPLGAYIKKGADRLLQERAKQFGYGTFRLLIVTDGEAQDRQRVDRYTPEVISRGITIDVIGVAMDQAHTLATRVHSYRPANNPDALKRALTEVFAEVGGRNQDTTESDLFAQLAPIPAEVAAAAIQALSTSGNHPIGESPAPPTPHSAIPRPDAPAAAAPPTPVAATPPPVPQHERTRRPKVFWLVLVVGVILPLLLRRTRR